MKNDIRIMSVRDIELVSARPEIQCCRNIVLVRHSVAHQAVVLHCPHAEPLLYE